MKDETLAIHAGFKADPETRAVSVPIYQTVAYAFDDAQHGADLFNLDVDLIFYDTTTASFHIDSEDDPYGTSNATLRKFGHGKEGFWAPQVVVALAVTREGVPVRSWVLPGNTADVSTVEKVRSDLRGWNLGRAMFVADSGMNSADNRRELAKACGKYLLACRMANVEEIKRPELDAQLVADSIAHQLQQRIGFRRAMKRAMQAATRAGAEVVREERRGYG